MSATTLHDFIADLEQRAHDADAMKSSAPVGATLRWVVRQLRELGGADLPDRMLTTEGAARILGVKSPRTVERWCREGRFDGAYRTSGDTGQWRLPSRSVYSGARQPKRTTPKLLEV